MPEGEVGEEFTWAVRSQGDYCVPRGLRILQRLIHVDAGAFDEELTERTERFL